MAIVRDNAFGYDFGQGIDGGTGSVRGEAVNVTPPQPSDEGQASTFLMKKIETIEDLTSSLQISIDGEAEFSMFGGSNKFSFVQDQKIHSYHLYLFLHTVVVNAPVLIHGTQLKKNAFDLIATDGKRFHEEFGDFFVMGKQGGGEFAALLDIHTKNATEHQNMSDKLDAAGFGGGFAFATDAQVALTKFTN